MTLEAETALRRLGALEGFSRRAAHPPLRSPTRRLGKRRASIPPVPSAKVPYGYQRTLQEVVLVRAVSVVEAYVFDITEVEFRGEIARISGTERGTNLVSNLFDDRWGTIESAGAWRRLLDFSKAGLGLNPRSFNEWSQLDLVRETRHAIVHRVGEVTPKYLKAAEKAGRLKELGLEPSKVTGLLPLDPAQLSSDIALCRSFVLWYDAKVRAAR